MPRKRTISDEALLDAALVIVRADGPDTLTFGALANQTGLAASTIVQRFGTKAALLQAALFRAWDLLDEATTSALTSSAHDASGVIEMLVQLTGQYDPEDYADQLLILREDLRDPLLHARGRTWLATLTDAIEQRLGGPHSSAELGQLIVTHWQGALTVWGFQRDAPLVSAVRGSLEALFQRLRVAGSP